MALQVSGAGLFLHIPRCGGTYIRAVLDAVGLARQEVGHKHDCPGSWPMDLREVATPHFCVVRHPLSWIESVWRYQIQWDWQEWPKWPDPRRYWWHPFQELNDMPARDFSGFITWVAKNHAGYVTRLFTRYADWPTVRVLRFDRLEAELVGLLADMGVDHNMTAAALCTCQAGSRNAATTSAGPARKEAVRVFLASEAVAIKRWFSDESARV